MSVIARSMLFASLFLSFGNQYAMDYDSSDEEKFSSYSLESLAFEFAQEERAALAIFPPVLGSLVALKPNGANEKMFLKNALLFSIDKKNSDTILWHVNNLCAFSKLSPETKLQVFRASKKMVEGESIDLSDPRLIYDSEREEARKHASINKMPYLLQQQCKENIDAYCVRCLLAYMLPESLKDISMLVEHPIASRDELAHYINHDCNVTLKKNMILSPYSLVITIRQFHNLIFYNTPVLQEVYDEEKEIALQKNLQNHFPKALLKRCEKTLLGRFILKQLTCVSYLLLNPVDLEILRPSLDENAICEERKKEKTHFYDDIKGYIEQVGYKSQDAMQLAEKFIEQFIPLSTIAISPKISIESVYQCLIDMITVEKGTQKYNFLIGRLKGARKILHAQASGQGRYPRVQLSRAVACFKKSFPTCPICLHKLSGYFNNELYDTVAEAQLPCSHKLCVHCVSGSKGCCPVCPMEFAE